MAISLDEARTHLNTWLQAELAVASGQEYTIEGRSLTRASLNQIAERIRYWRAEVERLEFAGRGMRVMRVVPRDL